MNGLSDMHQDIEEKIRRLENGQVWAEICYLDSCSDYREYLHQNRPACGSSEWDLVMLEDLRPRPKSPSQTVLLIAVGLVILFVGVYFCYVLLNPYW
ncbi:MAG TPA: hypothetical protein VGV15_06405 [Terriglobales bacterium]|nr:hypothetical protein [Terriglobales bacterium]